MDGYQDGYQYSWNLVDYPIGNPVQEPIANSNDPIIQVLAAYIKNIINNYITPSFAQELTNTGLFPGNVAYTNGTAVGNFVNFPLNPSVLVANSWQFPLISLYREEEKSVHFSLVKILTKSHFVLHIVLPPLTPFGYNRLYNFLSLINKTVNTFLFQGYDPLYQDGAPILVNSGLSFLIIEGAKYYPIVAELDSRSKKQEYFNTIEIRFNCNERQKVVGSNYEPMTDVFVETDMISPIMPDSPIFNLADGYVQPNLTISSISASSGPIAGGTNIFISGTGFDNVESITFCGVPVNPQFFIKKSNTLFLVQTSATITPGLGDVVLTSTNGDITATLTNSFTYT